MDVRLTEHTITNQKNAVQQNVWSDSKNTVLLSKIEVEYYAVGLFCCQFYW